MTTKQAIFNFIQLLTPNFFKKIIPVKFKTWVANHHRDITFDGWGMKTQHELPWNGGIGNETFRLASRDIKKHFELSGDGGVDLSNIDALLWRHWIVSYCIRHVVEFVDDDLDMVECGVSDGLSAFFALREMQEVNSHAKMHLYDSWASMRDCHLSDSEKGLIGKYINNSMKRTQKNLSEFNNVIYHPGYVPESLNIKPLSSSKISFLSIDLNSVMPTIAALEYFFPKLVKGGIILFDDYGWIGYASTKKAVDIFFKDKTGILMPLPTGQAIYYR